MAGQGRMAGRVWWPVGSSGGQGRVAGQVDRAELIFWVTNFLE